MTIEKHAADATVADLLPNEPVRSLAPYKQGKSEAAGHADPIKVSSNESPLGASARALEAYRNVGDSLFRYPNGAQTELRNALGEVFDLNPDRIVCGNGSEEVQSLLIRAFVSPGDEVIVSEHAFVMARIHATVQGANIVDAPEPNHRTDVDEILNRVTRSTRMIVLASPNNPIGDYLRRPEFDRLVRAVPPDVIIVYDGAYADFVTEPDFTHGFEYVPKHRNVVVTRTFSKLYGLAGLRIGWMYGDMSVIEPVQRIRTPFNANIAALAAAEAAVRDVDHSARVRDHNSTWLKRIRTHLEQIGLEVFPTVANFYLIRFPDEGPHTAQKAYQHLMSAGIIPRPVNAGGPSGSLRITVGLDHENEAVLNALTAFMEA